MPGGEYPIEQQKYEDACADPNTTLQIATTEAIRQLAEVNGLTVIGSGGLRNGLDTAKAIALGADLAGMAFPFLEPATESADRVAEKIERTVRELKIAMLCVGARTIRELKQVELVKRFET